MLDGLAELLNRYLGWMADFFIDHWLLITLGGIGLFIYMTTRGG